MKFRRRKREKGGIEASSLSDILFFLMLFFLMVSTLASQEAIKVLLPKATTGKTIPRHTVYVSIDEKLHYYVNKQEVSIESLKSTLRNEAKKQENVTIVIRVDKRVPAQDFINVIEIANKLSLPVVVATDKKQ
ncbi:MAG TPA: biopolymer transporter ExbD [Cytophagaceae bacterium]|jgi:biopolymer transport protein ExbD|nr:biopolymer transporter ExbD [Cytophagaceae bacterium]